MFGFGLAYSFVFASWAHQRLPPVWVRIRVGVRISAKIGVRVRVTLDAISRLPLLGKGYVKV